MNKKEIEKLKDKRISLTKMYSFEEVRELIGAIEKSTIKDVEDIINNKMIKYAYFRRDKKKHDLISSREFKEKLKQVRVPWVSY